MTPGTHSTLAPSGAARVVQCHGSLQQAKFAPADPFGGHESAEGVGAHWVLEQIVGYGVVDIPDGTPTPVPGVLVNDEMIEGAHVALNHIAKVCNGYGNSVAQVCKVEEPISLKSLHPDCWGTPDVRAMFHKPGGGYVIHVWDYKFGHRYVDAFENWQGIAYSKGMVDLLCDADPAAHLDIDIHIHIVQPRAFHRDGAVRTWKTSANALRPYYDILMGAFASAMGDSPTLTAGPSCRYCPAIAHCQQAANAAADAMDLIERVSAFQATPKDIGVRLRQIVDAEKMIEAMRQGLEEQASYMVRGGHAVPGWTLADVYGRESWTQPPEAIMLMAQAVGGMTDPSKLLKKPALVTPRQAVMAGMPQQLADSFTHRNQSVKLVPVDTNRAVRAFS